MIKILLPTDFSENAWNATRYAINLFKNDECMFYLVNTYTPAIIHSRFMATTVHGGLMEDNVKSQSENGLQVTLSQIQEEFPNPNHHFKTVSSFSILTEAVKEIVENEGIDYIITGTKGATGFDEVFMGSNSVRIIKGSRDCPVITVPREYNVLIPQQIAFATDFKRSFNPRVLDPLLNLAKSFDSSVHIVHIQEDEKLDKFQQANMEVLLNYLGPLKSKMHSMPYFASKSDVLEHFLEENPIDLLAIVNYRHGFLEELIREPVVKRVAFHTKIPLLVLSD